jgi:FkbM family methyltransferase
LLDLIRFVWSHPANRQHRLRALGRVLAFQARGRVLKRPTIGMIGVRSKFVAEIGWTGASKAIYANPPDWPEMLVWRDRLEPGDLFIDVGANVGMYSLWAAELGAEVIAIEPGPRTAERLRANVALNDYAIEVIEAAATDTPGTVSFDPDGDAVAHLFGRLEVEATTLDIVAGDRVVAGVKIDVEGAERLVLTGASKLLTDRRLKCIQIEWNAASEHLLGEGRDPTAELLRSFGYSLFRPSSDGTLEPTDSRPGADVFAMPDPE